MTDIPTLLPPDRTPPIRTPDDLLRQWQAFMGPLGFGSRMLWFVFIDHEGHVMPELPCIEDLPIRRTDGHFATLSRCARRWLRRSSIPAPPWPSC